MITFLRKLLGCTGEIDRLRQRATILAEEREFFKKGYETLASENNTLKTSYDALKSKYDELVKNGQFTQVDVDFHRITVGRRTQDKPSAHSPLTRQECKNVAKNVVASKKELHAMELFGDTNSMEPNIDDNHIIILHKYDPKTYTIQEEDVVRYLHPTLHVYVLHRVIEVDEKNKKYLIRGDNNPSSDGWIAQDMIKDVCCGTIWGEEPDNELDD